MRCSGKAARTQQDTAVSSAGRSTARLRLPQGGGARRFRISLWVGVVCVWGGVGDVGLGRVAQADVVDLAPLGVPRARVVEVEQALEARHLRAEERARVEDAPLGAARQRPAGICERSQLPHAKPGVCTERRAGMRHRAAHWEASRENNAPWREAAGVPESASRIYFAEHPLRNLGRAARLALVRRHQPARSLLRAFMMRTLCLQRSRSCCGGAR